MPRRAIRTGQPAREVRGPAGWEDISLRADQDLAFDVASRRERQRVTEQQVRALERRKA